MKQGVGVLKVNGDNRGSSNPFPLPGSINGLDYELVGNDSSSLHGYLHPGNRQDETTVQRRND